MNDSPPTTTGNKIPSATIWRRFMGAVYESLLLFGPLLLISFLYSFITDFSDRADPSGLEIKRLGLQITLLLAIVGYFVWGWSKDRCTLPMQTLGLRVHSKDGEPVTPRQALIRALIAIPSTLGLIGFLWCLIDKDSQSLYDKLAGTRLVYIPVKRIV
ncbi:MAG: hypothetical protein RJA58_667 [Pseudomonadota bacterium]